VVSCPWVAPIQSKRAATHLYNRCVSMPSATVLIRPIRLGFLLDLKDRKGLLEVLRTNACLWGGVFNYLIPVPKMLPRRYRDRYLRKNISGRGFVDGLIEAFQPDFLVETTPGLAMHVQFDRDRVLTFNEFNEVGELGQRKYGIDLRSVCRALYHEAFRFVQRHPPKVIEPRSTEKGHELLFAAAFGEFPATGNLAQCREHYRDALDGKEHEVAPDLFHELFAPDYFYPLRAGT